MTPAIEEHCVDMVEFISWLEDQPLEISLWWGWISECSPIALA